MGSTKKEVSRIYRENSKTYSYHSRWVKARTAKEAVDAIGRYNQFKPSKVKGAVDAIQASDPNARFSIGREGSPVIYVETGKPRSVIGVFSAMDDMKRPDELGKANRRQRDRVPKKSRGKSLVRAWWD